MTVRKKLAEKLSARRHHLQMEKDVARGSDMFERLSRLASGKRTPTDFLAEEASRVVAERYGQPPQPEQEGSVLGMSPKLWLGMVGTALELFAGVKVEYDTNPAFCKHPIASGHDDGEKGFCLTCKARFTRESPSPRSLPCKTCRGPTCVCGCGACVSVCRVGVVHAPSKVQRKSDL